MKNASLNTYVTDQTAAIKKLSTDYEKLARSQEVVIKLLLEIATRLAEPLF